MPEAKHTPSTSSRRHVLAALSGAAFAGGALVLAMPTEAPAVTIIKPNNDAALLAACAEYRELHATHERLSVIMRGADDKAGDAAYDYCDKFVWGRSYDLTNFITETPAATPAGLAAKADVLMCDLFRNVVGTPGGKFEDEADPHEKFAMSLARDVVALAGGVAS